MVKRGDIVSRQEAIFAGVVAGTQDKLYAAAKAGYAQPRSAATKLMQRPAVLQEIARQQEERLFSELLPAAVSCLASIIGDAKAPAGARVQATKIVLDRTLGAEGAKDAREPHEMSAEEIAKAIEKLEREASSRARNVSPDPGQAPAESGIFE